MADVIAASSDVVEPGESNIETGGQSFEPAMKKQRKEDVNVEKRGDKISSDERLETRLGGILCCSVCLDLPSSAVYQVNTTFSIKAFFFFFRELKCMIYIKQLYIYLSLYPAVQRN